MSKNNISFLEDSDAEWVTGLINWMAKSLDPFKLSKAEAMMLFMILSRAMAALWRAFERELSILVSRHLAQLIRQSQYEGPITEDDEHEPGGPNGDKDSIADSSRDLLLLLGRYLVQE